MNEKSEMPVIQLAPGGDKRLKRGYPWVYSNEIRMDEAARGITPGTIVNLLGAGGQTVAVGSFNPQSLICFRRFSSNPRVGIGRSWIGEKLKKALNLRQSLFEEPFYRLVHAEADGLPGLVIDRYGDVLAIQANTAGIDRLMPEILAALASLLSPKAVVLRNDSQARTAEGLETGVYLASGQIEGPLEIKENGLVFLADPMSGQKTGWFFDQRDNRAFVSRLGKGRSLLDVYSYGGGFGVTAAAGGARSVTIIDSSAPALALAKGAAERNGFTDRCTFVKGDAYAELERLGREGMRFGVVACDPPAFVKSKRDMAQGLKGYRKLAALAARLVEPEGFLFMASCSHNVEAGALLAEVATGIGRSGRTGRVIRQSGAAPDHPLHPQLPESAYLKAITLALD